MLKCKARAKWWTSLEPNEEEKDQNHQNELQNKTNKMRCIPQHFQSLIPNFLAQNKFMLAPKHMFFFALQFYVLFCIVTLHSSCFVLPSKTFVFMF